MEQQQNEPTVINVTAILETVGGQIDVVRKTFIEQKEIADKAGRPGTAKLFDDLLAIVDNMGVCWYALDLANKEIGGNPEIARGGGYLDINDNGIAGQVVDALVSKIKPADNIRTFAARELLEFVETVRNFETDKGDGDLDFAIKEVIEQGGDPAAVILPQIHESEAEAQKVIADNQYKTLADYNGDHRAFITAALAFQHAINISLDTPRIIDLLLSGGVKE